MVARESKCTRFVFSMLFYAMVYGQKAIGYTTTKVAYPKPAGIDGNWRAILYSTKPTYNAMGRPMMAQSKRSIFAAVSFLCCWMYTAYASCRVFCRVYMAWRLFFPSFYFSSLFYHFFWWEPLTRTKGKTECFSYIHSLPLCQNFEVALHGNFGSIEMEIFRLLPKSGIQNPVFIISDFYSDELCILHRPNSKLPIQFNWPKK